MVLVVKNPPANAGNAGFMGSIPGSGRSPGEGHGNPLQYSCLKNPMDRGDWWSRVHRITKNPTQRNNLVHTWQKETELEPTDGAQGPTFSKKGAKDECFSKATRSGSWEEGKTSRTNRRWLARSPAPSRDVKNFLGNKAFYLGEYRYKGKHWEKRHRPQCHHIAGHLPSSLWFVNIPEGSPGDVIKFSSSALRH